MMDILLKHQKSLLQISNFLAEVLKCSIDKIKTCSLNDFNSLTEELDAHALDCICVFSFVQGDAAQLLQLYRYKMSDSNVIQRIVDIAMKNKICIYVPNEPSDDWIYIGDAESKRVRQIESDADNCFYFRDR
jgi:hypothetical protein